MTLVDSCVNNPVKVAVGVLVVALFGVISLTQMPMQLTPEVQTPTITVETLWPGGSPQEVEQEIIQPQEEQLKSVTGLVKLSSESMESRGVITLEFQVGTDMSEALIKVNSRLQQVPQYPETADQPILTTASSTDTAIAWFILRPRVADVARIEAFQEAHPDLAATLEPARRAVSTGLRLARLKRIAQEHPAAAELLPQGVDVMKLRRFAEDEIEAAFERVAGVANSNVLGGREDELQVVVDPRALAARSLTIEDLRIALRERNKDTSAGTHLEGKRQYVVRTMGRFESPEQVEGVVVARRDGKPVYVRDVAEVRFDYKKPDGVVQNFGTTSLAINVIREVGANVLDVMEELRDVNARINAGVLADRGLELELVYDETDYIESSVDLVNQNILIGGLLTILVLLVFLRSGRSTLILAIAIPSSIIGTFIILALLGRSLNVISLAGMAFAVGMVVDNSVVVLENIYRHYQEGMTRVQAAVKGTTEVWGAVVASTLTTLAVFLPVVFIKEEAGQLFRDIALAISSAVGLSLLVSVIVIPTAASRILRHRLRDAGGHVIAERERRPNPLVVVLRAPLRALDTFGRGFVAMVIGVNRLLQKRLVYSLLAVLILVGGAVRIGTQIIPKVEYLPTGNQNLVFGVLLPPPGYNMDMLVSLGQRIEQDLRPYWDVDPMSPEADLLEYPPIKDFFYVARGRQVFLGIRAVDPLRSAELIPLITKVGKGIPGTYTVAMQASLFQRGLAGGRTINIEISGNALPELVAIGGRIFGMCMGVLPTAQVRPIPSLDLSNPELRIFPRWDTAADLGVDATSLGYAVDAFIDGAYATDYFIGGDKIDLSIVGAERFAGRTQDIGTIPVVTPSGNMVMLGSIADVTLASGPEQINHRERRRTITVEVTPPPEMPLEEAMDLIRSQVLDPVRASGMVSPSTTINLSGTADKLKATWDALKFNVLLALLITYLLMAALFESWVYPVVIIVSVPIGAVGGLMGLWVLNHVFGVFQPLDDRTMLGVVMLIGIVVNNAILIVHQTLANMRDGMERDAAMLESVRTRIRPIFMTTVTTVCGLLPLVVFPGAGSELYRGLGSVVLAGLLVSTFFTLVLVPSLFHLFYESMRLASGFFARVNRG